MRRLSSNRSESSYLAGGVILNLNWPRRSDDIDIFHDTDESVSVAAQKDIADLESGAADLVYNVGLQDFIRLKSDNNYQAQLLTPPAGFYQKELPLQGRRVVSADCLDEVTLWRVILVIATATPTLLMTSQLFMTSQLCGLDFSFTS